MPRQEQGLIQVYTGAGKGKTTAALGLCLRAAGHGMRSHIVQFMKGQVHYGELTSVKKLDGLIELTQGGRESFVSKRAPDPEDIRLAGETLKRAREIMAAGKVDILVLDEINMALDFGLIGLADALDLINAKPDNMELVVTGRNAPAEIIERADLVTEMREVKHYWNRGVACRTGIEC
jgi:cob(I)alamin adenosyltransferase